jgi:ABC-type lipoprotein release transport system permease subunit
MVIRQAMRLAIPGVAGGVAASFALARFMKSLIYGVKPLDPLAMTAGCFVLLAVALAAAYFPARRASRGDAMSALRSS